MLFPTIFISTPKKNSNSKNNASLCRFVFGTSDKKIMLLYCVRVCVLMLDLWNSLARAKMKQVFLINSWFVSYIILDGSRTNA